ncbi:hypothetical protein [Bacillus sp. FJAT-18017]|uniref:hypothetical protein n=1 Tax=Bacillus sp. FJAT-18017 TaxID=1705566 RepID=UPI000A7F7A76|nr:hypothetical protein [Bacillus sp. FJAT-18017]
MAIIEEAAAVDEGFILEEAAAATDDINVPQWVEAVTTNGRVEAAVKLPSFN